MVDHPSTLLMGVVPPPLIGLHRFQVRRPPIHQGVLTSPPPCPNPPPLHCHSGAPPAHQAILGIHGTHPSTSGSGALLGGDGSSLPASSSSSPSSWRALRRVLLLVGPEGDFTPGEVDRLLATGRVVAVGLGRNRLRTETAAIALLSLAVLME